MVSGPLKLNISESEPMRENVSGYDSQGYAEIKGHVREQSLPTKAISKLRLEISRGDRGPKSPTRERRST